MDTFPFVQILLVVASVGPAVVFLLIIALLFYLLGVIYTLKKILEKVEKNMGYIAKATISGLGELKNSAIVNYFLKKKKNTKSKE